jgi:hypothetical protein
MKVETESLSHVLSSCWRAVFRRTGRTAATPNTERVCSCWSSQINGQMTGGGLFAARPIYTLALEAACFVTPDIAIALSTGVPPLAHMKAAKANHRVLG